MRSCSFRSVTCSQTLHRNWHFSFKKKSTTSYWPTVSRSNSILSTSRKIWPTPRLLSIKSRLLNKYVFKYRVTSKVHMNQIRPKKSSWWHYFGSMKFVVWTGQITWPSILVADRLRSVTSSLSGETSSDISAADYRIFSNLEDGRIAFWCWQLLGRYCTPPLRMP